MRPVSVYRSRLFWIGTGGLAMLAGLWIVSLFQTSFLMIDGNDVWFYTDSGSGSFYFEVRYQPPPNSIGRWDIEFDASAPHDPEPPVPELNYDEPDFGSRDYVMEIKLPYWLLMIVWTLAWAPCMVWWLQRKRRLVEGLALEREG